MKGYPHWTLRALVGTTTAIVATGLLLTPGTLVMRAGMDLAWMLPSDGRLVTAALHATAGFPLMLFIGALWSIHMRAGWRKGRRRASGLALALTMPLLALSAVGVYYFGGERLAAWAAYGHLGIGAIMVALFAWHWMTRRH